MDHGAAVYGSSHADLTDRTPEAISEDPIVAHAEAPGPDTSKAPVEENQHLAAEGDASDTRPGINEVDFSRRDGTWEVYTYYTRSAGPWIAVAFVASIFAWTFLSTFSSTFALDRSSMSVLNLPLTISCSSVDSVVV